MLALRENFLGADFRPVGLSAGSRALVRVVEDLEWLADRVSDEAGPALRDMQAPGVRVLRCSARGASSRPASPTATPDRADLEAALDPNCGRWREGATARTSTRSSAQPDDDDRRSRWADDC